MKAKSDTGGNPNAQSGQALPEPPAAADLRSSAQPRAGRGGSSGLWASIAAFGAWGILPIYWKSLDSVQPLVITLHRVFWSFCFLLVLLLKAGQLRQTFALLRNRRTAALVLASSLLLSVNWLIFIWAVNNGHMVESSLGYFLNPILNMLTGVIFFRERPSALQWLAILLAFLGVGVQVVIFGSFPWISLCLGCSFAAYGALRKIETIDSLPGLFLETAVIAPVVIVALVWLWAAGDTSFTTSLPRSLLLAGSGVITTIPLLLFAYGAQRLNLTTVGLAQYLSPSITLLIGVFMYGEGMTGGQSASFALIWAALAIYSLESLRLYRKAVNPSWGNG